MTGAQLELLPGACPAPTGAGDQWATPPALFEALDRSGALHGMKVGLLDPATWGGHKDLAEAWLAGALDLQSLDLGPERSALDTVTERQAIEEPPALAQPLDLERISERISEPADDDGNPWRGIWDRVFGTATEEAIWLRRLCAAR